MSWVFSTSALLSFRRLSCLHPCRTKELSAAWLLLPFVGFMLAGVLTGDASRAVAASTTWQGVNGAFWDTSSNWSPAETWTVAGNSAVFNTAGASLKANLVYASSITFAQSATMSGGTINLTAGATLANNATGVTTLASALNLTATSVSSFWTGGSGTLNIAGPVSDTVGHLFIDSGNYTLSNSGSIAISNFALVLNDIAATTTNFTQSGGLISINRNNNAFYLTQAGVTNYAMTGGTINLVGLSGGLGGLVFTYSNIPANVATMTINGATALVTTPQIIMNWAGDTGLATFNLQNGIVQTDYLGTQVTGVSAFNFSGGTLRPVDGSVISWGNSASADNISITLSGSSAVMSSSDSGGVARTVPVYANLTGSGSLAMIGAGKLVLDGSNTSYSGQISINSGTLQAGSIVALGGASSTLLVNGGALDLNGYSSAAGNVILASGTIINSGTSAALNAASYTLQSGTASAVLGGSNAALNKTTSGLAVLAAANTYGGGTTVTAGTLSLGASGSLGIGAIVINPGAVLDVSKYGSLGYTINSGMLIAGRTSSFSTDINGSLNLTGGAIGVVGPSASGTLTIAGSLTMNNAAYEYVPGDQIALSGALTLAGTRDAVYLANQLADGAYKLFTYNGVAPNIANLAVTGATAGRLSYLFGASGGTAVTLTVTGQQANLIWNSANGVWDTQSTANWFNTGSGTADLFYAGDFVTFNDRPGGTAATVTINGQVGPGTLTVSNTAVNYTFTGSGSIVGGTSLLKAGPGTLTIANSNGNSYTGNTTIAQGTLQLAATNAIPMGPGVGNLAFSNAANVAVLDLNGNNTTINGLTQPSPTSSNIVVNNLSASAATLTVGNNNVSSTFAGVLADNSGSGGQLALTKIGTGALSLGGANTYSGQTTISGGTLALGAAGTLGSGNVTVAPGAVLDVSAYGSGGYNINSGVLTAGRTGTPATDINGTLNVKNATIAVQGTGATLTISGGLSLNNSTLSYVTGNQIAVGSALAFSGTDYVVPTSSFTGSVAGTTYTLFTYKSGSPNTADLALSGTYGTNPAQSYSFGTSGGTAVTLTVTTARASADFSGTPITFNSNGGWCWFQDPRAIITNGQLIIGSIAGVTGNGSNAGDADVTSYNFQTHTSTETLLHSELNQDDHACPAFTVLPDGRIMVVYETHGSTNNALWRVSTAPGETTSWSAEQTSVVNTVNDGNGNSYANPFYLSVPNEVVSFSRAVGFDPNYSVFTNVSSTLPTFNYGGHWLYWQNPNNTPPLSGGNGRPYVKYASNGTDTVWFATTEDSPQNYPNSLYVGYMKFNSSGSGTMYTSMGVQLGGLSTGTAPTGSSNPPTGGNQGDIVSGTGLSYLPTDFTPIVKANAIYNGVNLTGKSVGWASSMLLDTSGDPYLGFVVIDNLTGAYGSDLEYYYAHFSGSAWQVSRVGYAGLPLYNGQNQYAGLMAVDPTNPDKIYISTDVDPVTDSALLGPDGLQHWQIMEGVSPNGGLSWNWAQITDTSSDNVRPEVVAGGGKEALVWEQGSYTSFTDYNMSMVGLIETSNPAIWSSAVSGNFSDATKWTGGVPNAIGEGAVFSASTTSALTVTLDMPTTLSTLQFANSGNTSVGYTLSGSNTLTLNNSGSGATITIINGTHAINAPVVLQDNLLVTGSNSGWTLSFGTPSSISGSYSLTMNGNGTLVLGGSDNYTGGTIVASGKLVLDGAASLLAGSSLVIGSNAGPGAIFAPLLAVSPPPSATSQIAPVPEPGTFVMFVIAAFAGLGLWRQKSHLNA